MKPGQTLTILLVFMAIATTVTTAAVALMVTSSRSVQSLEQGDAALGFAESGVENALLRVLRDPSYAGETLTIDGGQATIAVSGTDSKTIVSTGVFGNFVRRVDVSVTWIDGVMSITGWEETY